ncbi:hypothetical protein FCIRC_1817 [Fusarium circinatum]|uniref:Uncharacterized protein n=1 Tax=Fusarium circinatum TaxID=48490 RepID=A0A8H5UJL1_FUSCI|nr:hypothetical protein FCIRC_1817 [Fusarium circinatum]
MLVRKFEHEECILRLVVQLDVVIARDLQYEYLGLKQVCTANELFNARLAEGNFIVPRLLFPYYYQTPLLL